MIAIPPTFLLTALPQKSRLLSCAKETVAYETFIGQDKNVKLQYSHCDGLPHVSANGEIVALDKRQSTNSTNV